MPEISEVARIVHFLRTHLKGRRIASVTAEDDPIVYGKVGTSAEAFKKALTGRTVLDAKQQGKYFWLEMDRPPHPLMHFGMTGWVKLRHIDTGYYKPKNVDAAAGGGGKKGAEYDKPDEQWPPRFCKFVLKMEGEPAVEAAFEDARRLGRIRLVDAAAADMRKTSPLKENGPDPVVDRDIVTEKWLAEMLRRKKSPVKAVLLDQANLSGVGNWVGDEVLYQAAIHPEQYSNTLSDAQIKKLHESLVYVCTLACDVLGDSDQFPDTWIFKHRWNKGKNAVNALPNGAKIVHLTVGGRTSAVVPSVQKKTGPVAGDLSDDVKAEIVEDEHAVEEKKPKPNKASKKTSSTEKPNGTAVASRKRKSDHVDVKQESKSTPTKKAKAAAAQSKQVNGSPAETGRRKSGRLAKG